MQANIKTNVQSGLKGAVKNLDLIKRDFFSKAFETVYYVPYEQHKELLLRAKKFHDVGETSKAQSTYAAFLHLNNKCIFDWSLMFSKELNGQEMRFIRAFACEKKFFDLVKLDGVICEMSAKSALAYAMLYSTDGGRNPTKSELRVANSLSKSATAYYSLYQQLEGRVHDIRMNRGNEIIKNADEKQNKIDGLLESATLANDISVVLWELSAKVNGVDATVAPGAKPPAQQ